MKTSAVESTCAFGLIVTKECMDSEEVNIEGTNVTSSPQNPNITTYKTESVFHFSGHKHQMA